MELTQGAVAAARALLRMPDESEAAVLTRIAETAIGLAEAFLGQMLVVQPREDVLAPAGGWQRLRAEPVRSITGAAELTAIDIDGDGVGWVRVAAASRVTVAYSAGLAADWDGLPVPIAQGVAMLAAHLFENRSGDAMPPAAVAALWRPYRRMRLAEAQR